MSRKRILILIALCLFGLLISLDLIYIFYKNNFLMSAAPSFCSVSSLIDCDGVAKTPYALFLGVPLAVWGALLYLTLLFLSLTEFFKGKLNKSTNVVLKFFADIFPNPRSYIAALGLLSFVISMVLACLSIFKIQKVCVLCFVTYFTDLMLAFTAKSGGSFFKVDIENTFKDFVQGAKKYPKALMAAVILVVSVLTYTSVTHVFTPNYVKTKTVEEFQKMQTNPWAITGNILGKEGAKVQIYLYSDFMCPYCRIMNIMIHKIAKEDPNAIEVHHMNFPLDATCNSSVAQTIHPGACELARYAIAAKKQGNYWGMVNAIYNNIPQSEAQMLELAKNAGFDTVQLQKDATSQETADILATQIRIAKNSYVMGTPSVRVNGLMFDRGIFYQDLQKAIKEAKRK